MAALACGTDTHATVQTAQMANTPRDKAIWYRGPSILWLLS